MTAKNSTLTQQQLKDVLHYDEETGVFTWVSDISRKVKSGDMAGCATDRYILIGILGKQIYAHRLAFLYMEGKLPPDQVDHINRNMQDNRWRNLRHANQTINMRNRCNNNSFIGVSWNRISNRWHATEPHVNGRHGHIGTYKTHLAACYARHAYDAGALK